MNERLRSHVTRTGFDLSMTHNQIEALVWLNEMADVPGAGYRGHWVGPIMGCERRGLTAHHYDPEESARAMRDPATSLIGSHYSLTRAGEMVIELLREAGIYEEMERALWPERFTRTGKRRKLRVA